MSFQENVFNSVSASTIRTWRGTRTGTQFRQPEKLPVLYDREGCPECRLVREGLTELDLDARIRPCPEGGQRFTAEMQEAAGGSEEVRPPLLQDPNTGAVHHGARAILEYLFATYRKKPVPAALRPVRRNLVASRLASRVRGNRGLEARNVKRKPAEMELYSFESSPYSRIVRERLCEMEVPYILRNLGKQQMADMGPPNFRFQLRRTYTPLPDTKRARFYDEHGEVQVPYLIDPKQGTAMFESRDILRYLDERYCQ